jgi:hypothetical protein
MEVMKMMSKILYGLAGIVTCWLVLNITHKNGYDEGVIAATHFCPKIEGGTVKITVNDKGMQYCVFEGKKKSIKVVL